MIRVNLLPHRKGRTSKKAIGFRNYLMITGGALVLVVVGSMSYGMVLSGKISKLTEQRFQVQNQLDQLKVQSAEVAGYEADRKTFEDKIKIIADLKKSQSRPVKFLDQVARQLPDRAWLTRMEEDGGTVTIVGRAMSNSDIVEMLRRMKQIEVIHQVQLVESRRISEPDLTAYEFTLTGQYGERPA